MYLVKVGIIKALPRVIITPDVLGSIKQVCSMCDIIKLLCIHFASTLKIF